MTAVLLVAMVCPLLATPPGPWDSVAYPTRADYTRILSRFPEYAERGWHPDYHDEAGLGYFGDGRSDENGQRTLGNFCLTYAWLATNPAYDANLSGITQDTVRNHALAAIRYRLRTHVTGDLPCTDGKPWGNHWQSAWWVSRMVPAVQLMQSQLTNDDRQAFARVVQHEADRHIGLPPRVGEYGDTKSEENAWDAEVVAWALSLYPTHPHAAGWRQALNTLCLNTFSVADDLKSTELVDGVPLNKWIGGPSIHPDFTIENHGPFHICYQICPQHSMAWVWYAFASQGHQTPAAAYHHLTDVWSRLKQFALWQGRFAYVGGKDWPRYAYGLYFILPALVHMQTVYGDGDARLIERQRVGTFEREQLIWNDGSFYSGRFTHGTMERWPSEWETDCAANLTIASMMHDLAPTIHPTSLESLAARNVGSFLSPYCEMAMRRDPLRFVGWSWRSYGGVVTGMVSSDRGEDMLEWNRSLAGSPTFGPEVKAATTVANHTETEFAGGWATVGEVLHGRTVLQPTPLSLTLRDTNVPVSKIEAPTHPLFTTPNAIASLAGLTDLDSVTKAGPAWETLASNADGGPSLLEAKVGTGRILVSMTNLDEKSAAGDPLARSLFENLLTYTQARSKRCAYLAGEAHLRAALRASDVAVNEISPADLRTPDALAKDLSAADVLFVDRTATAVKPRYGVILAWVKQGGTLVNSVLQDDGWDPNTISETGSAALRQRLACVALPDGRTTLLVSDWQPLVPATVTRLDVLAWKLANDVFNDRQRRLVTADAAQPVVRLGGLTLPAERTIAIGGNRLVVDGDLSVTSLGQGRFEVLDTPKRLEPSICAANVRLLVDPPAGAAQPGQVLARSAVVLRTRADLDGDSTVAGNVSWSDPVASVELDLPGATKFRVRIDLAQQTVSLD